LAVLEGDYYGYRVESAAAANFFARSGQSPARTYSVTDGDAGRSDRIAQAIVDQYAEP
jgi:hypothetical protein